MIHEIFDYLLTRSLLLNCSEQELIDSIDGEEQFSYVLDNIHKIMQEENFIIISSELREKVINFISKYRFDYIKNKDCCEKMNYIIGRFQDYEQMSDKRKKDIINNWVEQESRIRKIPKAYQNPGNLFQLIMLDAMYVKGILDIGEDFEIAVPAEMASLVNIIIEKAPEVFEQEPLLLEYIRGILNNLKTIKSYRYRDLKMIKDTYNNLNEKYDISEDVEIEVNYTLKKTKK